jgi:hypothetical protein
MDEMPVFDVRAVYECGWNLFNRRGFSEDASDISVNYRYLDHLQTAGINWLVVFWTNSRGFDRAWDEAVAYAHAGGIKVARGVYAYSGGGPSYLMAEPYAPTHLLRESPKGLGTALCPFDEDAREWTARMVRQRLEPNIDGIVIEPARVISRNCICKRCVALHPHDWDALVVGDLTEQIQRIRPDVEVWPYVYLAGGWEELKSMIVKYAKFSECIRTIFSWGADDEAMLDAWLRADPRFAPYTKLGRVLLFPGGMPPKQPTVERVAAVFRWCRIAAERGKTSYMFDYRIFGGREWQGHLDALPVTRVSERIPASLAVIGAALHNPHLDAKGQHELLERLRTVADWDLDDPKYFYHNGSHTNRG